MNINSLAAIAVTCCGIFFTLKFFLFSGLSILLHGNDGVIMVLAMIEICASMPFFLLTAGVAQRIAHA